MSGPSVLEEIYNTQHKSGVEQGGASPSTTGEAPPTNYRLMFVSMLVGALVGSVLLAPVLALYIEQRTRTTTSTTTSSTSTSSTTSTSTSTSSTTSTSTSTSSTSTSSTSTTTATTLPLTPPGVIWLWSGSIASVPQGWAICDGTLGTPDLRNQFIIGSGSGALYSPGQVGGSSSVTPTVTVQGTTLTNAQMPSHSHGGGTGIESVTQIYYDIYSTPCTSGPFGTTPPRWINTKGFNSCPNCQHTHTIASDGGDQPHTHTASSSSINITPPFTALLYIMKL